MGLEMVLEKFELVANFEGYSIVRDLHNAVFINRYSYQCWARSQKNGAFRFVYQLANAGKDHLYLCVCTCIYL